MEHGTSLFSLMIVVGIAFMIPLLLYRLKIKALPIVVAEIIAGILIGKSGLNLISNDPWLELLSTLGFIYLMFLSGLEIDFSTFRLKKNGSKQNGVPPHRKKEPVPALIATIIFAAIFILSYILALGLMKLGLIDDPYLITLIISTISLGVVVPVLKERNLIHTTWGQTLLLVAVISDFATMILLAVYVALLSEKASSLLLLLVLFVIVIASYYFINRFLHGSSYSVLRTGTVQIGTRGVFALILFFVALSETMGAENILGAFLAGVIVSLLSPNKEFVHQLDSFGYGFLIPIFFVMVGVNLELGALFSDRKILLLIPVLLLTLYTSKMIPALLLKPWYSWRKVMASGILLTSTLSLVIAAATIALQLEVITAQFQSALILVALITCFISPILFNQLIPEKEEQKEKITIIGANQITLPVSLDLERSGYEVRLFGTQEQKVEGPLHENDHRFPLIELPQLDLETLQQHDAFTADILVIATSYDEKNMRLGQYAQRFGVERIILRIENPASYKQLEKQGFSLFSTLYATRILLKAYIEHPSAVKLMTQDNETIQEIVMQNLKYNNLRLRQLPILGNSLILRIYRGNEFIIPHGDTVLLLGDHLIVSGSSESIQRLRQELE